jgi:hypothetical protein
VWRSTLNVADAVVGRCVRTASLVRVVVSAMIRFPEANSPLVAISKIPVRFSVPSYLARAARRTRKLFNVTVLVVAPEIGVESELTARLLLSMMSSPLSLPGPCK